MSPNPSKLLLTDIVASGTRTTLRTGLMAGPFLVGDLMEIHGRKRTIVEIDKREHRPSQGGYPYVYRILYVS